ncbi:PREDICTED: myrosinase 1-like [Nicrophorus vespilloides]|uniref:Myrosinase 1-like n=1 Tax=Nicrophorus vespilloides TaxID=110193 RepID=A0ABM1MN35_NICVS|nr:PREDICTED: myrosinase 1-like [Nicrophorus vespilloides]
MEDKNKKMKKKKEKESSIAWTAASNNLNTESFPEDFEFGVATSSYQIEGAWNVNGKGESQWDYVTHNLDWIVDGTNGDVACDSYNKYKEDVKMLSDLGVDYYRFSFSWPRIFPDGKEQVNSDGVRYYNDLINELIAYNITPMVTLFHWDVPRALVEKSDGLLGDQFPAQFAYYADFAFETFGDRVKTWFTFNEPNNACDLAIYPNEENDYKCTRNVLLAHAKAYRIYDETYRTKQQGTIAMVIDSYWHEPKTESPQDKEAADRYLQFMFGIWAHPIYLGDYPLIVKALVEYTSKMNGLPASRLPLLTEDEVNLVKGTHDNLFALNFYSSKLVSHSDVVNVSELSRENDAHIVFTQPDEWPGPPNYSTWLRKTPWGLRKMLNWIKQNYNNPDIIITENGYSDEGEMNDLGRIDYYKTYLSAVLDAIHEDEIPVKAYTAWSLMDNFEWLDGYKSKFGFYSVDFNDPDRKRSPKQSADFYKKLLIERRLVNSSPAKMGTLSLIASAICFYLYLIL